jgi:hypothetical protein
VRAINLFYGSEERVLQQNNQKRERANEIGLANLCKSSIETHEQFAH